MINNQDLDNTRNTRNRYSNSHVVDESLFKSSTNNTIRFKEKKVNSIDSFENTAELNIPSIGLSNFVNSKFDKPKDSINQSRNGKLSARQYNSVPRQRQNFSISHNSSSV